MKITFLGAVEEVTGSKYFIENKATKILVDCGLFQGNENINNRNWEPFPIEPGSIEAIIVTHAHIDHTGYIPRLVKDGFKGKIYCSKATFALSSILLVDSGLLQEENARKAHDPNVVPLYTQKDAENSLKYFEPIDYDKRVNIGSLTFKLISSHHILGASFVVLSDGKRTLTFSGDLGRPNQLIMKAPPHLKQTDYLVLESTYGNRLHSKEDPLKAIGSVVRETLSRDGILIIPTFAVGRAQTILYILYQLKEQGVIQDTIPIFLDSPMAIKVNNLFCEFKDEHKFSIPLCQTAFSVATYTPTKEESKRINGIKGPAIIVASSGMAGGGRVLYHFEHLISDYKNTVLFVGYQAEKTVGRSLTEGAKEITIFGRPYKVHAQIKTVDMLSAHADYNEILAWLSFFESSPKKVFITHGEIEAAQSLKKKIEERFGWSAVIPKYLESFELD
jgi:metallo-beta-lactamase family protein